MTTIHTTRTQGHGIGHTIGFPTINSVVNTLPCDIGIGLYAVQIYIKYSWYKALAAVSKDEKGFRIETHVVENLWADVGVGDAVRIKFISKLRGYKRIGASNRNSVIEEDKQLALDFFAAKSKCESCKFFMSQDHGYSNYTVEGTDYICLKGKFKTTEDEDIKLCNRDCVKFEEGESWCLDVDGDEPAPTKEWLEDNNCSLDY